MFVAHSYPRAALIGNPSDGYFGKCIAFVFSNFKAEVKAEIATEWSIHALDRELENFSNLSEFQSKINAFGYYGGNPLMLAGLKVFVNFAQKQKWNLPETALRISYRSNIPTRLGLAGSSALITALFKVLMQWSGQKIDAALLANLVLAVEKEELGIGAGLQDRVAQAFEHPVFMDFDKQLMERQSYGNYQRISLEMIQDQLFIAYSNKLSEGSEKTHNKFQQDFENGKKEVLQAIENWKKLTQDFANSLKEGKKENLAALINKNFDIRTGIMQLKPEQVQLVKKVRELGAAAKFSGSGGAVIALADSTDHRAEISKTLKASGIEVIYPQIVYSQI